MYCKVSHDYRSMLNTYIMLENQCDYDNIIFWPLALFYINDHFKNIHCLISQNVNFRINTLLHGALQMSLMFLAIWFFCEGQWLQNVWYLFIKYFNCLFQCTCRLLNTDDCNIFNEYSLKDRNTTISMYVCKNE